MKGMRENTRLMNYFVFWSRLYFKAIGYDANSLGPSLCAMIRVFACDFGAQQHLGIMAA